MCSCAILWSAGCITLSYSPSSNSKNVFEPEGMLVEEEDTEAVPTFPDWKPHSDLCRKWCEVLNVPMYYCQERETSYLIGLKSVFGILLSRDTYSIEGREKD